MNNYREIVTKAVVSKGKKLFTSTNTVTVNNPSTILGCWVINHNFNGVKEGNKIIVIDNFCDFYNHDTKTDVIRETNKYSEVINMRERDDTSGEEIIVRSLKQPNCVKVDIDNNNIIYTIEKELGIELVGDIKVKIEANLEEDPWDEIVEENTMDEINEDFIEESL